VLWKLGQIARVGGLWESSVLFKGSISRVNRNQDGVDRTRRAAKPVVRRVSAACGQRRVIQLQLAGVTNRSIYP